MLVLGVYCSFAFLNNQIIPSTVYVKEEFGSCTEFPNECGKFNFAGFHDGTSFEVMGDENNSCSHGSLFSTSSTTLASRPWAQNAAAVATTNTSSISGGSSKGNTKPKATVKVVFAADIGPNGKPVVDISQLKQTFVPIHKEEDANIKYILSVVETNFNDSNLELVGSNGFRYNDEPGIRGTPKYIILTLTRSRRYICVCNLDLFHLVGNDLWYTH